MLKDILLMKFSELCLGKFPYRIAPALFPNIDARTTTSATMMRNDLLLLLLDTAAI